MGEAAAAYDPLPPWDGHEGPRARVTIAPGAVGVQRRDLARRERTAERELRRRDARVDELAAELDRTGEFTDRPPTRAEITGWSRKSRANMVRAFCEIDYRPMLSGVRNPAMVTLTYPGDWQTVAPNGAAVKAQLQELRHRYRRAWGTDLVAIWKMEFQRRGAPHFHLLMSPPHGTAHTRAAAAGAGLPFREWLSVVWADIVDHPDPQEYLKHLAAGTGIDFAEGAKAVDPRRVSIYFCKHGSYSAKEYQHIVPMQWREPGEGPGRFWGYWVLQRLVHAVEVPAEDAVQVARTLRRWAHAQGTMREARAPRMRGGRVIPTIWEVAGLSGAQLIASRGRLRHRKVRRRVRRLSRGAGWVSVNDGPAFAIAIARYIARLKDGRVPDA
ncbi:MAG TPA: hypothetical protein VFE14_20895 [Micromonosporaceae bacterium]|nr:hypothetical protein [Micromonosporaceae bacterium]